MSETTKVKVKRKTIEGVKYFIDDENILYNPDTKDKIGIWDEESKTIQPLPDDNEVIGYKSLDEYLEVGKGDKEFGFVSDFSVNVGEYKNEAEREYFVIFDKEEIIPVSYLKKYDYEINEDDWEVDGKYYDTEAKYKKALKKLQDEIDEFNSEGVFPYKYSIESFSVDIDIPKFIQDEGDIIRLAVNFKIGLYSDNSSLISSLYNNLNNI
jgi:hypothetical protein